MTGFLAMVGAVLGIMLLLLLLLGIAHILFVLGVAIIEGIKYLGGKQ